MCFKVTRLKNFMKFRRIKWSTVREYGPMSKGYAERMVGKITRAVAKTVALEMDEWDPTVTVVFYRYSRRRLTGGYYPFEWMFGVVPPIYPAVPSPLIEYTSQGIGRFVLDSFGTIHISSVIKNIYGDVR